MIICVLRFVLPSTTIKHSLTNSSYVPPDASAPSAAGDHLRADDKSRRRRSAAEGSTNDSPASTVAAQRSTNDCTASTRAALRSSKDGSASRITTQRSQSWSPPGVTYTALLSTSSCGHINNSCSPSVICMNERSSGGAQGEPQGAQRAPNGGPALPVQLPEIKGGYFAGLRIQNC